MVFWLADRQLVRGRVGRPWGFCKPVAQLWPRSGVTGNLTDRHVRSIGLQPRPTVKSTHYRFVISLDTGCTLKATGSWHAAPATLFDNCKHLANLHSLS